MTGEVKEFEIWSEGFAATGEHGGATLHGVSEGRDFKEACSSLAKTDLEFTRYYDFEKMTYWGCHLFDNEADARKSFG